MAMTLQKKLEAISEEYYSPWMSVLRIATGLIIWIKGYLFIVDSSGLIDILKNYFGTGSAVLAMTIAGLHLITGFFIIAGLLTRVSCAIMLPVIGVALFYVNTHFNGVNVLDIYLSAIVFLLLIFNFVMGSGKFSVYYYMIHSRKSRETDEAEHSFKGESLTHPLDKEGNIV